MDSILLGFSLQSLQKLTTEYGQQCCCLGVIDHVQETAIQWQRFSITDLSYWQNDYNEVLGLPGPSSVV